MEIAFLELSHLLSLALKTSTCKLDKILYDTREPLAQACGKVKSLRFCSICALLEKCQRTAMGHRVLSPQQMESTNTLLP